MTNRLQSATGVAPGGSPARAATVSTIVAFPRSVHADHAASTTGQNMAEHSRPVRVLVIDDDPAFRNMVATYLDEHDIHVTLASVPQALVSQLVMDPPSLIVLDLRLSRKNELDLLREIRSRCDVPVITTGDGCSEIDRVAGLELGADDHMTKPFGLRELLARIRAILRGRNSGRSAAT